MENATSAEFKYLDDFPTISELLVDFGQSESVDISVSETETVSRLEEACNDSDAYVFDEINEIPEPLSNDMFENPPQLFPHDANGSEYINEVSEISPLPDTNRDSLSSLTSTEYHRLLSRINHLTSEINQIKSATSSPVNRKRLSGRYKRSAELSYISPSSTRSSSSYTSTFLPPIDLVKQYSDSESNEISDSRLLRLQEKLSQKLGKKPEVRANPLIPEKRGIMDPQRLSHLARPLGENDAKRTRSRQIGKRNSSSITTSGNKSLEALIEPTRPQLPAWINLATSPRSPHNPKLSIPKEFSSSPGSSSNFEIE